MNTPLSAASVSQTAGRRRRARSSKKGGNPMAMKMGGRRTRRTGSKKARKSRKSRKGRK